MKCNIRSENANGTVSVVMMFSAIEVCELTQLTHHTGVALSKLGIAAPIVSSYLIHKVDI